MYVGEVKEDESQVFDSVCLLGLYPCRHFFQTKTHDADLTTGQGAFGPRIWKVVIMQKVQLDDQNGDTKENGSNNMYILTKKVTDV